MNGESAPNGAGPSLAGFYAARLDEDEGNARQALALWAGTHFMIDPGSLVVVGFHRTHGPPRVLREVAAGRAILTAYEAVLKDCSTVGAPGRRPRKYGEYDGLHLAVSNLAAVYSDHPDYRDEWKP